MDKKRGQITPFIIIGILLLFSVGLLIYVSQLRGGINAGLIAAIVHGNAVDHRLHRSGPAPGETRCLITLDDARHG